MVGMMISEPVIVDEIFDHNDYMKLSQYLINKEKIEQQYDPGFGRFAFTDPFIDEYAKKITPIARKIFNSETLLPSYSLFCHYEGNSSLYRHVDDNACTYTLDMCVYQNLPWGLGVQSNGEDKIYYLHPNQALAYYGNEQEHWRENFPSPEIQYVAMIFFHFVEPDHWFFKEGPDYIEVLRGNILEEEWKKRKQQ